MTALPWKIARDQYLGPLAARLGEQVAWDAGFFADEDPEDASLDDVDWLCTPAPRLEARGPAPFVLLATGGFCPVHAGHLAMMQQARAAAEAAGWEIIGGYLSPGHDAYVRLKAGAAAIPASERLRLCAEAIARGGSTAWLSVDPWEALHRRVAVNYTDVAARLERYLRAHVHPAVTVAFVCGGDNARFASAFVERGACVVVGRPGWDKEWSTWRDRLVGNPRVLFIDGTLSASSRDLRAASAAPTPAPTVLVRLEDARVVRTLGLGERLPAFQDGLLAILRRHARVRVQRVADAPATEPAPDVISLDPMHPAQHNLAVSRSFAIGGYQALGHVARPDEPSLEEQLARIPPGEYRLRDDDVMTGETLQVVRRALPASVRITGRELALHRSDGEDVLDARDFLLGADDGGLVLAMPRTFGRAPYLLPYVDPFARASLPDVLGFSREVWDLNARLFAGTDRRVSDLPPPARRIFARAASADESLEDLCRRHADRLTSIASLR